MKLDHKVTLTVNLTKIAENFGYNIDPDAFDDISHNGYSSSQIRQMGLRLSKELDMVDQIFPIQTAQALEDAERDAWAAAVRTAKIKALEEALEKIDLLGGGAEYQDSEGEMVSAKAGVISAKANSQEDTLTIEFLNPEHLINAIFSGVGTYGSELSSKEAEPVSEIEARLHHLPSYFSVWGERKPDGDLSSQFSPDTNDEYFYSLIADLLENLSEEEVAEAVIDAVDNLEMTPKDALKHATRLSKKDPKDVKKMVIDSAQAKAAFWTKNL